MLPRPHATKEQCTSSWGKNIILVFNDTILVMGSRATEYYPLVIFVYSVYETIVGKSIIISMAMLDCPTSLGH